ncbi:MAG: TolC family protein [Planctomycetes bacterium]|nr:TolC family protein [Planctomycetota bacterium]
MNQKNACVRTKSRSWHFFLKCLLILISSNAIYPLQASEFEKSKEYTSSELYGIALENNPEIKSAFHDWQAAMADIAIVRSLPDPQISYSEFIEEVQTRVGPQRRKFSLTQKFPWFGTLDLRKDAAAAKAAAIEQKVNQVRLILKQKIEHIVFDLILIDRKISINKDHFGLLQDLEKSQKGGLSSGKGHLSTVLRIQVEKETIKDQIETLKAMKHPLKKKLEAACGIALPKNTPKAVLTEASMPALEELRMHYKKSNPRWLANKHLVTMSGAQIALAKKKGKPNLGLGLTWIDTGTSSMPSIEGSGDDPLALTLSLSIPLWRKKVKAEILRAEENQQSLFAQKESLINAYDADIELILFRIQDAERKIMLYRDDLLPKSSDAYHSTKKAHESGRVSFQNVLDAERLVLRFSLDLEIALVEKAKGISDLELTIGTNIH